MGKQDTYIPTEIQDAEVGTVADPEGVGPEVQAASFADAKDQLEQSLDEEGAELLGRTPDQQNVTEIKDENTGKTQRFD